MRTVLVTGATGYIGGRLVPVLLDAGFAVRCLVRSPRKLAAVDWADQVDVVPGDIADPESVRSAMAGCEAAYFLVHSMGGNDDDFAAQDRRNAQVFAEAAADTEAMERIVYLGGLGVESDDLSPHLASRHEVGEVLAAGRVPVTELRAAVIIGSGSASFEMLRNLVEVLPVMVTPRWVDTKVQPIAIRDILHALRVVLDRPDTVGRIVEVGGPDVLTYREMMHTYAQVAGLRKRRIIPVPVLTPGLSSRWVGLVTPLPGDLAMPLVESLVNEVVVTDDPDHVRGDILFDDHPRISFRESLELALRRIEDLDVRTRWSDAALPGVSPREPLPSDPQPSDPGWSGGTVLADEQSATVEDASPAQVYTAVSGIGGDRGWFVADVLWTLRGVADKIVGGPGMRRGRRDPDRLRVGDALDFWRVEEARPPGDPDSGGDPTGILRLRAEMKLPGEAWLEWRIEPDADGARLTQRAIFTPRGLFGRVYWYVMAPFHHLIFARLAHQIADRGRSAQVVSAP